MNTISRREARADSAAALNVFTPCEADFEAITPPWAPPVARREATGDFATVVAGHHPGRVDDAQRTLYLGPSIPAEHIALGAWIYRLALDKGVGTHWGPCPN